MLITDANKIVGTVHDRMPVILEPEGIGSWLLGNAGTELLQPAPKDTLRVWPVSKRVSKPGSGDDASLIEPLVLDPTTSDSHPGLLH
jgi:putative SOS response-associated peptidase YedK